MIGRRIAVMLVVAPLASVAAGKASIPVRADHHLHLHSPAILNFLPGYCNSPGRISRCDPAFLTPHTPQDLLAEMKRAKIRRGLIMSTAYIAESPMMVPANPDAPAIVRRANDWTVGLAARYPSQLSAFIGINPLTPTALSEIARWRGNPYVAGIKLHLTNSGVDLRRDSDVAALANVFRAASAAHFAIMIHMRTRAADYGERDVRRFLTDVLPNAGSSPVQIAHAAGWGGIDASTLSALSEFAKAVERDPQRYRKLWFDLAAVWKDGSDPADEAALVALIRRIGLRHFLPASDYPFTSDLTNYYGKVYPQLPLTRVEWHTIRVNVAPYAAQ